MFADEDTKPLDVTILASALKVDVGSNNTRSMTGSYGSQLRGQRSGVGIEIDVKQTPEIMTESKLLDLDRRYVAYYNATIKVRVDYKFGRGPVFQLLREGTFRSWLKRFGYQDIEVGDSSLDFALTIKGEQEDDIRELIMANRKMLTRYVTGKRRALPTTDGQCIECKLEIVTSDAEESTNNSIKDVGELIDLLVSLATTDIVGMDLLMKLPEAEEARGLEDRVVVRVRAPILIEFYPERDALTARLRARLPLKGLDTVGPIPCSDRKTIESHFGVPELPLSALGDAALRVDEDGIWLEWPDIVNDLEVLNAATRLLAFLSSPAASGAYR